MSERVIIKTMDGEDVVEAFGGVQFVGVAGSGTPEVLFQDMDGDGDLDVVVTGSGEAEGYWLNNGIGESAHTLFQNYGFTDIIPTALGYGDIDGDGELDMVVGYHSGVKVFHGNDAWTMVNLGLRLDEPRAIAVADIDYDGKNDIVIRDSQSVVVVHNTPDALGSRIMAWPDLGSSNVLAVGEFDITNSQLEILTMDANKGSLAMIRHSGSYWQAAESILSVSATQLVVSDMNGDGIDDIYLRDTDGNQVWLEGDGTGGMVKHSSGAVFDVSSGTSGEHTDSHGGQGEFEALLPEPTEDSNELASPIAPIRLPSSARLGCFAKFGHTPASHEALEWVHGHESSLAQYDVAVSNDYSEYNEVHGTHWGDFLSGSSEADVVFGGGGGDFIHGGAGDDKLFGQGGDDQILAAEGDDILIGGHGSDTLCGEAGNDFIVGGQGEDMLLGGDGNDILVGAQGYDLLFAGDGDDIVVGGQDGDLLLGGTGCDTFVYTSLDDAGDLLLDFKVGVDTFEFTFSEASLDLVEGDYSGDSGDGGDAFVWSYDGGWAAQLYYDADISVAGDETCLAVVVVDNSEDVDITPDTLLG